MPRKKYRTDFDQLRQIPITTVAEALGLPLVKTGPGTWAVKDGQGRGVTSLVLFERNNKWKRFSGREVMGISGGSTIDLVMYSKECSLEDATDFLSRYA